MQNIISYRSITLLAGLALLGLLAPQAAALDKGDRHRGVHALFDLATPAGGPFPSDRFTVRDRSHNTGRRVNLPKPDCAERPSDCEDIDVLNTLDPKQAWFFRAKAKKSSKCASVLGLLVTLTKQQPKTKGISSESNLSENSPQPQAKNCTPAPGAELVRSGATDDEGEQYWL